MTLSRMANEFDLSLSPTVRRSAPTKGRRANQQGLREEQDVAEDDLGFNSPLESRPLSGELLLDDSDGRGQHAPAPPHGRRTGGWADEVATRAKTAKSVRLAPDHHPRGGIGSDDEEGIPIIPDLDDVRDEDMAFTVAEAPSVTVNRVATYKELDNDLLKHVAFATLDDIDLKLLTKRMAPEAALKEPDEAWHWDVVFAEVSGELQKEWSPEDDIEEGENKNQAAATGSGPTKDRPYTAFNRFPV